jgi:hypothetical protein
VNRHGLTSKAYIGSELDIFFRYEVKVWREVTYDVSKRKLGFVLQHNTGNRVIWSRWRSLHCIAKMKIPLD